MKISMPTITCLRCGWKWTPRKADVRKCPNCKSALFDVPKAKTPPERGQD